MIGQFTPEHINATEDDLAGNNGVGRYLFLPGSEGRAKDISEHFENVKVNKHPRGHHLYMGTLDCNGKKIDVATISSGMGCPSMEIVLHELFNLGAKRFLRIGTAGTLQPAWVKVGSLVNAQASVRDDGTTVNYTPIEIPAIASLEFISSILHAAGKIDVLNDLYTGIVHCKGSLYAREFSAGPRAPENLAYLNLLSQTGVLATEMETATLFIQSQIYNYQLMQQSDEPQNRVLAGAILAVVGTHDNFDHSKLAENAIQNSITLGIEAVKTLATQELFH